MKSIRVIWVLSVLVLSGPAAGQPAAQPAQPAATPAVTPAPAPAATPVPEWKPFQEFAFLLGSWSGTAESGKRVGGRVARFAIELGGSYLVHRGSTVLAAEDGRPEETIEEVGYFAYDRDRRSYVATYFFSTGVFGTYDVTFLAANSSIRLVSRDLLNFEAGGKARLLMARRGDTEFLMSMEIAPPGKEYLPYISSRLTKK